ncbi:MAG: TetR/AcrR family transcriptional regulator [Actinomycetota bacterium]
MPRRKVTEPQAVIDAAARLFQRKGYQNTTIDDLAEEVGISKPTVYQYVKSKGWLLETIFETVLTRLEADQDRITSEIDDPADQLRETIRYYINAVADLQPYFHIFFGEENELPKRTQKRFREWSGRMTDKITVIVRECARRKEIRADIDPRIASFLVIGMLASVYRWYDAKGPLGTEEIAAQASAILEGFFVNGARPKGSR